MSPQNTTHAGDQLCRAGHLALIGGALDESPEILNRIVSLARKRRGDDNSSPRIAIFTTASEPARSASDAQDPTIESDLADGIYYAELFARHGAIGVPIPVGISTQPPYPGATYLASRADEHKIAGLVKDCDGVFLGGGNQSHYVRSLFRSEASLNLPLYERHETAVLQAIHAVLDAGGIVAGTSAGLTIQQGRNMVSGGGIHSSWAHGTAPGLERTIDGAEALSHIPSGGLNLFTEAALDSHFSEWCRPVRAIRLAHDLGNLHTIGVDEHTALFYECASRRAEVVGKRGVSLLDLSECSGSGDTILGTRWSYLVPGDRHDFVHNTTTRGTRAVDLELDDTTAEDLWSDDGRRPLLQLALSLVSSSTEHLASGESGTNHEPQYRTTLGRDRRTTSFPNGGFSDLTISITPITRLSRSQP